MLDIQDITQQLSVLAARERPEIERVRVARSQAQTLLDQHNKIWQDHPEDELARSVEWLVARPSEPPAQAWPAPERPATLTAVATDGSQIYPDPHYSLDCCLVNVSRIAFQYGTMEPPLMETSAKVAIREIPEINQSITDRLVSAWRDQLELEVLLDTAKRAARKSRPLVAMVDGTLIRWMLQAIDSKRAEQYFIDEFTALLSRFRSEGIPICAYTSLPNATEVSNLLRLVYRTEALAGVRDRQIFDHRLKQGERSGLFESSSHIKKAYNPEDQVFFFYVRVEDEIGRVEVPRWVADDKPLIDLIHAFVVSECAKGGGYPMILAEAHERAVIRRGERELFYFILEQELGQTGLNLMYSRKAQSKRRPVI